MIPNSDGYVRPSFSRLPPPLGDIAREQLRRAFQREPPFHEVPRFAYDHALSAMTPPEGLSSNEFRQLCWEGLNGLVGEPGSEEWRSRSECLAHADRKMAKYLAVSPMLGTWFRLTRRHAESAIRVLTEAGDLPPASEASFEFGSDHIQIETLSAGVNLRLRLWSDYGIHPMIDTRLDFMLPGMLPVAFAIPHRIFFERIPAIPRIREDFAPLLRKTVREAHLLQETIAAAFASGQ